MKSAGFLSNGTEVLQNMGSFQRLFGPMEIKRSSPKRGFLANHDVTHRNPVTGQGMPSPHCKAAKRKAKEQQDLSRRNPVTGEGVSSWDCKATKRKTKLNQDVTHRNPVTGQGVSSWDCKSEKLKAKVHQERNPVTGDTYLIACPTESPTKLNNNSAIYIKTQAIQNGNM
ncbi:uncharacterized protein LOC109543605 [Dendroctonus ponderosae]|uniref:Uncharacterized protein n=2 Tax=Dendroctonus ponderosae TaxID=77166 RepID=A0AAR5Q740_DENPD|nr:uncharacterized protein LOC109543605 [Dendroctonus ponderosae]KAH1000710.1 hypothetical protein HUJ04_013005 [Dendroctonus ponderosae]KAH1006720.1 hypothetical protein HUJ05_007428 [Dendroctonus ponderosae]